MRVSRIFCSVLLTIAATWAQSPPLAFDVASIRPAQLQGVIAEYSVTGMTVTLEVFDVPSLITEAYGLEAHQLVLSPEVFRTVQGFYTIQANVPGTESPTRTKVREMLQELLASRFRLKIHRESRETPVYSLLIGKSGVKMREVNSDAPGDLLRRYLGRNQIIEAKHVTMQELARELRGFVDRPIIDNTRLTGKYDIVLEATPYRFLADDPQPNDITVFTAIQETLGLRLETERVAMPIVVVDAVDRPSEN